MLLRPSPWLVLCPGARVDVQISMVSKEVPYTVRRCRNSTVGQQGYKELLFLSTLSMCLGTCRGT